MLGDERIGATPDVGGAPIMVGASHGELPPRSTMVGESDPGGPRCAGISINVGESEAGEIPEEELSPGLGVRIPAPPGSGESSGGRPLESSSIRLPSARCRDGSFTQYFQVHGPNANRGNARVTKYITLRYGCQRSWTPKIADFEAFWAVSRGSLSSLLH